MKLLRIFYVHHVMTDRKKVDGSPAFEVLQCSRDFDQSVTPEAATRHLELEMGTPENWESSKGFVRVSCHRLVEPAPVVEFGEAERVSEMDLFPAIEVKRFSGPRKK